MSHITICFAGFVVMAMAAALVNWRRALALALIVGVLQDPARKLTPNTPVAMTYSIVLVYFVILFAAQRDVWTNLREFGRRFTALQTLAQLFFFFLIVAALNGLWTFGLEYWKVPALSLFIYCSPVPAVILGYTYLRDEGALLKLFTFYAAVTSIAMIGTPLEYLGVESKALGIVALPGGLIRHLPGIQIRILSGFYRAPDIMGWHAAMLCIIGITMALHGKVLRKAWPWIAVAGWGFLNCVLSGRRKAVYIVAVFALVLLWRYFRRLTTAQVISFVLVAAMLGLVILRIKSSEHSRVYAEGTVTSREEIFQRLEGGLVETINQFGIMGAGLGVATQGVSHLLEREDLTGWQEGGLAKLAVELGVPGLLVGLWLGFTLLRVLNRIARHPDVPGTSQLLRVALFGIIIANVIEFLVSAQAYSDAVLTLMTAFLVGCAFATSVLDERLPAAAAETAPQTSLPLQPQTA